MWSFHLFRITSRLQPQLHFLHVFKYAKPQARRTLIASANDENLKVIVQFAINTLIGNHKLNKDEWSS